MRPSPSPRLALAFALALLGPGSGCVHPRPRRHTPARAPAPIVEAPKDYDRTLPPGAHALRRITDPRQLPDLTRAFSGDREGLLRAVDRSLHYLAKASSKRFFPVS